MQDQLKALYPYSVKELADKVGASLSDFYKAMEDHKITSYVKVGKKIGNQEYLLAEDALTEARKVFQVVAQTASVKLDQQTFSLTAADLKRIIREELASAARNGGQVPRTQGGKVALRHLPYAAYPNQPITIREFLIQAGFGAVDAKTARTFGSKALSVYRHKNRASPCMGTDQVRVFDRVTDMAILNSVLASMTSP